MKTIGGGLRVTAARASHFFRASGIAKPSLRCIARKSVRDQTEKAPRGARACGKKDPGESKGAADSSRGRTEAAPPEVTSREAAAPKRWI